MHKREGIPKHFCFFATSSIINHTFTHHFFDQLNSIFIMSGTYKPTEHGGLKEDGTPDKRVGTGGKSPI